MNELGVCIMVNGQANSAYISSRIEIPHHSVFDPVSRVDVLALGQSFVSSHKTRFSRSYHKKFTLQKIDVQEGHQSTIHIRSKSLIIPNSFPFSQSLIPIHHREEHRIYPTPHIPFSHRKRLHSKLSRSPPS